MKTEKNYNSTYSFRQLRLYRSESYNEFKEVCRDSAGISATKALNDFIECTIESKKLPCMAK